MKQDVKIKQKSKNIMKIINRTQKFGVKKLVSKMEYGKKYNLIDQLWSSISHMIKFATVFWPSMAKYVRYCKKTEHNVDHGQSWMHEIAYSAIVQYIKLYPDMINYHHASINRCDESIPYEVLE